MINLQDAKDFREMYLKHRVFTLGDTRDEALADFRNIAYNFMQHADWRDPKSEHHPHKIAVTHHQRTKA